jgi:hypothetical protein
MKARLIARTAPLLGALGVVMYVLQAGHKW